MIVKENVTINGREFIHTYSDMGYEVERDGVVYGEAYDPVEYADRTYTEVIPENEPELTAEEALNIILGGDTE